MVPFAKMVHTDLADFPTSASCTVARFTSPGRRYFGFLRLGHASPLRYAWAKAPIRSRSFALVPHRRLAFLSAGSPLLANGTISQTPQMVPFICTPVHTPEAPWQTESANTAGGRPRNLGPRHPIEVLSEGEQGSHGVMPADAAALDEKRREAGRAGHRLEPRDTPWSKWHLLLRGGTAGGRWAHLP